MALITPYKWYEGFPMIIVESFAVGCPVLSSNIGNAANIVSISNGGLFLISMEKILLKKRFGSVLKIIVCDL